MLRARSAGTPLDCVDPARRRVPQRQRPAMPPLPVLSCGCCRSWSSRRQASVPSPLLPVGEPSSRSTRPLYVRPHRVRDAVFVSSWLSLTARQCRGSESLIGQSRRKGEGPATGRRRTLAVRLRCRNAMCIRFSRPHMETRRCAPCAVSRRRRTRRSRRGLWRGRRRSREPVSVAAGR